MTVLVPMLLALVPVQGAGSVDVGVPERVAPGLVRMPHDWVVTQLLVPGDLDGNGTDDLIVARVQRRMCAHDDALGAIDRIPSARFPSKRSEGVRGQPVVDVVVRAGVRALARGHHFPQEGVPTILLGSLDGRTSLWNLPAGSLSIGHAPMLRALPALEPGGDSALLVANAWGNEEGSHAAPSGVVARLSVVDGSTEWVHWAAMPQPHYGLHLAAAGDVDGDGANDVAVCVPFVQPTIADPERRVPHLEFLSGADGSVLGRRALEAASIHVFRGVGDLDGDALEDFVVQTSEPARGDGPPTWLLLSGTAVPTAVFPEREVLWFAPWRDESAAAALLVAARERGGGAGSLQRIDARGAQRFADLPEGPSARVDDAVSGDFDGNGELELALLQRSPCSACEYAHEVRVVSDFELR